MPRVRCCDYHRSASSLLRVAPLYYGGRHEYGVGGRSSRCWRWRRSRRRSRPHNHWRSPVGGPARGAILVPCGGGAPAAAPSRTNARSIMSRSPFVAAARAGSCRASTRWQSCCCGPVARSPRASRRRSPRRGSPSGSRPPTRPGRPHRTVDSPDRRQRLREPLPPAATPVERGASAARPRQVARRPHRPHGRRAGRARPVARRPLAHRARRPVAGRLQDVGWPCRAAGRCPGRRTGQPRPPSRRVGRGPPRLALAGARRTGRAAPLGHIRTSSRHAAAGAGRLGRGDHRLAGAPGRCAGRRAAHRSLGGDGSQRHPRRPHRGTPDLAARCHQRGLGDGAVVRRLSAEPRRHDDRRHARCTPMCSATRVRSRCEC